MSKACSDAPEKVSLSEVCRVGGTDSSIVPAKGDLMDSTSSGEGFPVDSKIFSSCTKPTVFGSEGRYDGADCNGVVMVA